MLKKECKDKIKQKKKKPKILDILKIGKHREEGITCLRMICVEKIWFILDPSFVKIEHVLGS